MGKRADIDRLDNEIYGEKRYMSHGIHRIGGGLVHRVKMIENTLKHYVDLAKDVAQTKKQLKDSNKALRHRLHEVEEHLETHGEIMGLLVNHLDLHIDLEPAKESHLVLLTKEQRNQKLKDMVAASPFASAVDVSDDGHIKPRAPKTVAKAK